MMQRTSLILSLQFGQLDAALRSRHRAALARHRVSRWIRHALSAPASAEMTVRIVGEEEGRQLNREWRHKDYATNVLTFAYGSAPRLSADLVLCAPVVEREALAEGRELAAHYAHLLVHGTLHAQGWDHETSDAEAKRMEAREVAVLQQLGFADPYC